MMDLYRRFETALNEIVEEMKAQKQVRGVFTFGSYVKGTTTIDSDLDVCVVWDEDDAPVELIAEKKDVRIDLLYKTVSEIQKTLSGEITDVLKIGAIVGMLRDAKIAFDRDGLIKKWQETARGYSWSDEMIASVKKKVDDHLRRAVQYNEQEEDSVNAVHELRCALFEIGRVILMRNNIFTIVKPAEILNEVRMLDPITYQLFLRAFKLKRFEREEELTDALGMVKAWMQKMISKYENSEGPVDSEIISDISEAQRQYYGSYRLTLNGEYELAILEMCEAINLIGRAMVELDGHRITDETSLITLIRNHEEEFFNTIVMPLGSFQFPPKAVRRSISEAQFIAQRI